MEGKHFFMSGWTKFWGMFSLGKIVFKGKITLLKSKVKKISFISDILCLLYSLLSPKFLFLLTFQTVENKLEIFTKKKYFPS